MGNYTAQYGTGDITEASIDLFAVILIGIVAFGGLIGLFFVVRWFMNRTPQLRKAIKT